MVKYAIKSKHSKYIQYNKSLINKLAGFADLAHKLNEFALTLAEKTVEYQKEVDNVDIIGFIDFFITDKLTGDNTIVEFKTTHDLSLEHILQTLIYDYILDQQADSLVNNHIVIINALKGTMYEIELEPD